jgi:hypothetical protein
VIEDRKREKQIGINKIIYNPVLEVTYSQLRWLTPVILATKGSEIRRLQLKASPSKSFSKSEPRKIPKHKKGLTEWFKW